MFAVARATGSSRTVARARAALTAKSGKELPVFLAGTAPRPLEFQLDEFVSRARYRAQSVPDRTPFIQPVVRYRSPATGALAIGAPGLPSLMNSVPERWHSECL
jgi:hypothetical protein